MGQGAGGGPGQKGFSRPWWAEKERIFPLRDEAAGGQLVDQCPVHLLVEIEIESIKGAFRITEARLLGRRSGGRTWRRQQSAGKGIETRSIGVSFSVWA